MGRRKRQPNKKSTIHTQTHGTHCKRNLHQLSDMCGHMGVSFSDVHGRATITKLLRTWECQHVKTSMPQTIGRLPPGIGLCKGSLGVRCKYAGAPAPASELPVVPCKVLMVMRFRVPIRPGDGGACCGPTSWLDATAPCTSPSQNRAAEVGLTAAANAAAGSPPGAKPDAICTGACASFGITTRAGHGSDG